MNDLEEYWLYFRQFVPYYAVALCTLAHFVYTELTWMPRMDKPFRLDDRAISQTYVENELVSGNMCILLTVLIPMTLCLAYCTSSETDWRKSNLSRKFRRSVLIESNTHRFHCAMVMLWVSVGITGMLTNVLKFKISNFRPDFIARCQPKDGLIEAAESLAYVADACSQSNTRFLVEGMKSTPSGHSSMVTCGCCYAWKWIYDHVTSPSHSSTSTTTTTNKTSRVLYRIAQRADLRTVWLPLLTATVMASRLFDHRHHWYDVLTGCLLGLTCVHAVYFHWSKRTAQQQPTSESTFDLPT